MLPIDINQRTIVPLYPEQNNISSASEAVDMEDLLTEILLRLPAKSLLRFKCVSRHWDSLISSPHFTNLRYPDPCSVSGLFYHPTDLNFLVWDEYSKTANPGLKFVPLRSDKDQSDASRFESITRIPNLSGVIILNSCHGLSLCLGYNQEERKGGYHVLNPTTKQFATLPDPHLDGLEGLFLAYDPSISPHYKVVSVWNDHVLTSTNPNQWESYFQIEIYSSETKSWKASGEKFTVSPHHMAFEGGVFWNGAINWWSYANPLYFNIEEERLGTMSMTPIPPGKFWYDALHLYYGESRGHLHFAEIYSPTNKFDIYEMKKDYSEWFVKYHVDLTEIATNYPEMALVRENWYCSYAVLSIIRGEDDDDYSFLVLHIPGKFIRYNLVDKCFKTIYEYEGYWLSRNGCYEMKTYPYIESLSSV